MGTSKKKRKKAKGQSKSDYVKAPTAPPEVINRLHAVILVQTGQMTVSDAARQLGMSRNHFQSLKNKSLESMLQALTPKTAGRPSRNQEVVHLEKEVEELSRENEHLQHQVAAMNRIVDSLTEMVREQNMAARGSSRKRKSGRSSKSSSESASDPEDD
jgi:predicted ArsR family transcriptional regulator